MVISSISPLISTTNLTPNLLYFHHKFTIQTPRHIPISLSRKSRISICPRSLISSSINQNPPRTLFPGGYKRPEIKVPNLVLRLSSEELFGDNKAALDAVDDAVSDRVGMVVLTGEGGSGKKLYEAACLLKSVIKERAYLLIEERVDIAAAINASGVLLSDQGLPTVVARNAMMDAKNDSIVLPLVARTVQTLDDALDASNSEGADFLIYTINGNTTEEMVSSVSTCVKIPIFIMVDSLGDKISSKKASELLRSGASGVVLSLNELNLFKEDGLKRRFLDEYASNKRVEGSSQRFETLETLDIKNGFPGNKKRVTGFTKLEERDQQFIEKERSILLEAINVIQRATPLMGEISLLKDAVSQLDEPFLLVIVVIEC